MLPRRAGLALGLLAGTALDELLGDPRRGHPVAAFGRAAAAAQRRVWADSRVRGAAYATACVGGAALGGAGAARLAGRGYPAVVAASTWTVLGARSLRREAAALAASVHEGDLEAARDRLPHLCGRDPRGLPAGELARAGLESVAENTSDAAVAPLFWGAVAGVPGLLGYRAVNTLDAMVGHRTPRYGRFGWAAARLDDVANLVPARGTALLAALLSGRPADVLRIVRRDGWRHPSPNAGRCEAAFAGALGVRLGGRNVYAGRVDDRPLLGDGHAVTAADLHAAARLSRRITLCAAVVCTAGSALGGLRKRARPRPAGARWPGRTRRTRRSRAGGR